VNVFNVFYDGNTRLRNNVCVRVNWTSIKVCSKPSNDYVQCVSKYKASKMNTNLRGFGMMVFKIFLHCLRLLMEDVFIIKQTALREKISKDGMRLDALLP